MTFIGRFWSLSFKILSMGLVLLSCWQMNRCLILRTSWSRFYSGCLLTLLHSYFPLSWLVPAAKHFHRMMLPPFSRRWRALPWFPLHIAPGIHTKEVILCFIRAEHWVSHELRDIIYKGVCLSKSSPINRIYHRWIQFNR